MADRTELIRWQSALARFGAFVLDHDDLQAVLQEGCRLVAEALGADLAKVIEIDRSNGTGLVRAGVGWRPGIVGHTRVDLKERSSEAFAIETAEPVITNDIAREKRFHFPEFLTEHGVIALINVPIFVPGRKPYGILQVDAREPRAFDDEDIEFLQTYAMTLGPVIDRLRTVAELGQTDERLRLVAENARAYIMVLSDPHDRITDWLAGSEQILGWRADEVLGNTTDLLFTEEDRIAGAPERERSSARDHGSAPNVRWHQTKSGGRVFLDGQTIALRSAAGALRGYLKIAQDLTERERDRERQAVLLAELQHRVRNVLAMVRSIIRRTAAPGMTAEQMAAQLEGRIDALARTQALLTRAVGRGVDLENMVREELRAQAAPDPKVYVSGPDVTLAPKAAEILTLAVHELATNAVKYGALGQEAGNVTVWWTRERRGDVDWLRLEWTETGVQMPPGAARRHGFGTELITKRVPYELEGRGRIEMDPGGVHCTIELPLVPGESILDTGSPV